MPKRYRKEPDRLDTAEPKTDPTVELTDQQWTLIKDRPTATKSFCSNR